MAPKANEVIQLPSTVVSRADAARLGRELETISSRLDQAQLADDNDKVVPQLSEALEDVAKTNQLNLLHAEDRERLQAFLNDLKKDAPSIHMSFAVVPSAAFTNRLLEWLRSEIHPLLLLNIGLQPSIAAGCVIRTTNKYIDCSMRQHLLANRPKLVDLVRSTKRA